MMEGKMSSRTYRVGQVLYVLMSKETKIFPVQVVEEIIKRTITGESNSYIVKVGRASKHVPLSELDGEVFESVDLLREILMKKVMNTVNSVVDNAVLKASEWYQHPEVVSPLSETPQSQLDETVVVTLPDGQVANVKMPNVV
jgi:DNA recombination-dependent growth factor C